MGFWGFGSRSETHLVVVTYEGKGHLRLNGNHVRSFRARRNAAKHERTVCWIEFTPGGPRQGSEASLDSHGGETG